MTKTEKAVRIGLLDTGRKVSWLAERLGVSRDYIYDRYKDERWELPELRLMQELFRWKTLEG